MPRVVGRELEPATRSASPSKGLHNPLLLLHGAAPGLSHERCRWKNSANRRTANDNDERRSESGARMTSSGDGAGYALKSSRSIVAIVQCSKQLSGGATMRIAMRCTCPRTQTAERSCERPMAQAVDCGCGRAACGAGVTNIYRANPPRLTTHVRCKFTCQRRSWESRSPSAAWRCDPPRCTRAAAAVAAASTGRGTPRPPTTGGARCARVGSSGPRAHT
jgi:hypothetical protein